MQQTTSTSPDAPSRSANGASLLYLIKEVERAVRVGLDDIVAEYEITALQYTALTVLERHPGWTVARLARGGFVRAQTMAQTIRYLEQLDLVRKEADPRSRRQHLISLSQKGEALLLRVRPAVDALEAEMVRSIADGDQEKLRSLLRECNANLRERTSD